MFVVKVLNNSLVLAIDDTGNEVILMGKGIGFNKAIGYTFSLSEIEKIFVLKDRNISRNIIKLAAEVDQIYFEIAEKVIDYAKKKYSFILLDHIYLSLTDHISFAVKRFLDQIIIPNFYSVEMKKFNPIEYEIGLYAISLIENELGYKLPLDEAANIAFHFINAQFDHPYNDKNREINNVVNDILDIVKYYFNINYCEENFAYSRYVAHLRFFVQRVVNNKLLNEEYSQVFYENLKHTLYNEFMCLERINLYIHKKFGIDIYLSEKIYLAIHINRILNEKN